MKRKINYVHPPSSMTSDLSQLVPRLWPFLYHSSSVVRGSALKTLHTLTACGGSTNSTITSTAGLQFSTQHTTGITTPPRFDTTTSNSTTTNTTTTGEPQFFTTTAPLHSNTISSTSVIKPTTTQTADSDTTANLQSAASVATTENRSMHEKSSELLAKKEYKDKEMFETKQESGDEVVVQNKEESVDGKEGLVVKRESEIKCEDNEMPFSVKSENGVFDDKEKCWKKSLSSNVDMKCNWLPPIIQQLLTHIFQRALLEESDVNLQLVFKVRRNMLTQSNLGSVMQ